MTDNSCFPTLSLKQRSILLFICLGLSMGSILLSWIYLFINFSNLIIMFLFLFGSFFYYVSILFMSSFKQQLIEIKSKVILLLTLIINSSSLLLFFINAYFIFLKEITIVCLTIGTITLIVYFFFIIPNKRIFLCKFEEEEQRDESLV